MARYFYGCDEVTRGWESYFDLCNAVELDLSKFDEPPKIETLNGWRVDSPKNFCFILHLEPQIRRYLGKGDELVPDSREEYPDVVEEAWQTTLERASALAARALLVSTGESFSPGETNRKRMRAFVEHFAGETDAPLLWEPSGLWNVEDTCEFADEAGLVPVYDPFVAQREGFEFTHGDVGFVITERPGMRRQFDVFDFKELMRWTDNYDRVFSMLRGRHKWAHAQQFQIAIRQAAL